MPLYFTEGNEGLFLQINNLCDRAELESKVRYSVQTRVLIFNTLAAIVEDPSDSWEATEEDRRGALREFVGRLPKSLQELSETADAGQRVSYFDTLHWLSARLDSVCPFQKNPGRRFRRERQ